MARNEVFEDGNDLSVACTDPAVPKSGDPVRFGQLVGCAQTDERADGTTSTKFNGVHSFPVKGVNGSGNTAIAPGDTVFYVDGDTPKLSAKATGVKAGTAMAAVSSGATTTIRVRLNGAV